MFMFTHTVNDGMFFGVTERRVTMRHVQWRS